MNSRQRLLAALQLKKTDRVPISTYELVGYNSKSFENNEPSYKRLMDIIREKTDCVCMWDMQSNHTIAGSSYPVMLDTQVKRGENFTDTFLTLNTPGRKLTSSYRIYDNVHTRWTTEHWCKTLEDVDVFLSIPFEPVIYYDTDYVRIYNEVGENGIIMSSIGDPNDALINMMEFGEALVWAMTETEHFTKSMDEIHRRNMINLENMLNTRIVDLYRICGAEVMTPPYLPLSFFKRFVTPYNKEMTELIKSHGAHVRLHSHGKIATVLDEILSCGADALDPCEAPPDGDITLGKLKERVDGQLCLFGNLQLKLLEHADISEVREEVIRCMESAKNGGGYVIMPTAGPINVPLSSKTEDNYNMFIETALEYGQY
jgi:uroporphyrinogen-III decarboxylase